MASSGTPSSSGQAPRHGPADAIVGALIGPVFLGVAIWFLAGGTPADVPVTDPVAVSRADIAWPLRAVPDDPPTIVVAGFTKKCMECHSLFTSAPDTPLRLSQHRNIVQGHGMNDRCFNCHDNADRNSLVLPDGSTIGFREAPRLCAGCHGLTYRDWQRGMHGRTIGSWDTSRPEHARLTCTRCHDPHAPAFDDMAALPGPDTLRMGEPHEPVHDPGSKRNPLRQWSGGGRP